MPLPPPFCRARSHPWLAGRARVPVAHRKKKRFFVSSLFPPDTRKCTFQPSSNAFSFVVHMLNTTPHTLPLTNPCRRSMTPDFFPFPLCFLCFLPLYPNRHMHLNVLPCPGAGAHVRARRERALRPTIITHCPPLPLVGAGVRVCARARARVRAASYLFPLCPHTPQQRHHCAPPFFVPFPPPPPTHFCSQDVAHTPHWLGQAHACCLP